MKKMQLLLLFAALFMISCSKNNKLVGEWKPEGDNEKGSLIFNKNETFVGINEDGETDGMGFSSKNIKYKTDFSKTPAHLDLIILSNENEEMFRMRGIIEFLSDNTARIGFNTKKRDLIEMLSRPKSFADADSKVIRRR